MEDESYISFTCPKCGNSVEYLEEYAGTAQVCPFCAEDIIVPNSGENEGLALPLPIETPRLLLRKLRLEDFSEAFEIFSDPELFRFEERPPMDENEVKRWLDQAVKEKLSDPQGKLTLGIALQGDQKLIGSLWLTYRDSSRQQAMFGIQISSSYQRQGFGYESTQAALRFCFCDIGLHRVIATCDSRNAASVRLFTKLGMRNEAQCLRDRLIDGEWADSLWFAMLNEEFPRK